MDFLPTTTPVVDKFPKALTESDSGGEAEICRWETGDAAPGRFKATAQFRGAWSPIANDGRLHHKDHQSHGNSPHVLVHICCACVQAWDWNVC